MNLTLKFRPLKNPSDYPTPDITPLGENSPPRAAFEPVLGLGVTLTGPLGDEPAGIDLCFAAGKGRMFLPFAGEVQDGCIDLARVRVRIQEAVADALVAGMAPACKMKVHCPDNMMETLPKHTPRTPDHGWAWLLAGLLFGFVGAMLFLS